MYFEHLNQEEAVGLANYLRISIWNFNLGWAINNFRCYGFPGGGGGPVGAHFHPLGSTPAPQPPTSSSCSLSSPFMALFLSSLRMSDDV